MLLYQPIQTKTTTTREIFGREFKTDGFLGWGLGHKNAIEKSMNLKMLNVRGHHWYVYIYIHTQVQNWLLKKYQGCKYVFGTHSNKKRSWNNIDSETPMKDEIIMRRQKIKTWEMPTSRRQGSQNPESARSLWSAIHLIPLSDGLRRISVLVLGNLIIIMWGLKCASISLIKLFRFPKVLNIQKHAVLFKSSCFSPKIWELNQNLQ